MANTHAEVNGGSSVPGAEDEHEAWPPADEAEAKSIRWQMPEIANLDFGGPTVIMLEDPERHVDLAHVYEVLSHLDCTEKASLLNYASHNVSIGLSSRDAMPSADEITGAIKAVFGRGSRLHRTAPASQCALAMSGWPKRGIAMKLFSKWANQHAGGDRP